MTARLAAIRGLLGAARSGLDEFRRCRAGSTDLDARVACLEHRIVQLEGLMDEQHVRLLALEPEPASQHWRAPQRSVGRAGFGVVRLISSRLPCWAGHSCQGQTQGVLT
jgi:hypothetical protein